MFANLFGKYLVSKKLITSDQFKIIKKEQSKTRVKLGLIAVAEKLLDEEQANEINRKQALEDKRFGDIAIEYGFLTLEQVSHLLDLQGNPYMQFGQIVTDNGFLTLEQIEDALLLYQKENHFSDETITDIKNGDIDVIISSFISQTEFLDIAGVAIRTLNRVLTTDLWIGTSYITSELTCDSFAFQNIENDQIVTTGMAGMGNALLAVADTYARESFGTVNLDALDAVGEVINIIDGLYATALSEQNKEVELMPPVYCDKKVTVTGKDFCVVPLEILGQPIMLIISKGSSLTV